MKIKRVAKAICFLTACVAVGIYLYSHMHSEYSLESKTGKDILSEENGNDVAEKVDVIKIMEGLGVNMSAAAAQAVYSLEMETMKQEERCIDVNGNEVEEEKNPEWSKSDEGYYYYITQSYQGIPFYASKKLETDEEVYTLVPVWVCTLLHCGTIPIPTKKRNFEPCGHCA